jgi:hypothetical protein
MKRLALLLPLLTGCADVTRPALPAAPPDITVAVLEPADNAVALAGQPFLIRVAGREDGGRLVGLGFTFHPSGTTSQAQDSVVVHFRAVHDTVLSFEVTVPDTLGRPMYLEVRAVGVASGEARASAARLLTVLSCMGSPQYCP